MANRWVSSSLLFLLSLTMIAVHLATATVPAIFVFGDSTADVGTNNYLPTKAKANFLYNGIDFPRSRPTGRFSNGFNSADSLAKLMGFRRSPPPFLSLLNSNSSFKMNIHGGVNFASGGSGLVDTTGLQFGKVVSFGEQVQQFATVRDNLTAQMGPEVTDQLLSKSLFLMSVGSNDIFEYYYVNGSNQKQEFITSLTSKYADHLKNLFNLGARKFGIVSVPPIGCCPSQRVFNSTGGCLEDLNEYARMFYGNMQALMQKLNLEWKAMIYSLGNAYEMVVNFMENPLPLKIKEFQSACCGNGTFNAESPCLPDAKLCSNRSEYLFWDMYHPTQEAAHLGALTLFGGAQRFVTPINFSQLAEINN